MLETQFGTFYLTVLKKIWLSSILLTVHFGQQFLIYTCITEYRQKEQMFGLMMQTLSIEIDIVKLSTWRIKRKPLISVVSLALKP